ncbi:MAG TPA: hypothetical protein PLB32_04460, partial [Acidobacteriota bacterium]|nr:hypothetical protein [Acidobacteriota bacterium]
KKFGHQGIKFLQNLKLIQRPSGREPFSAHIPEIFRNDGLNFPRIFPQFFGHFPGNFPSREALPNSHHQATEIPSSGTHHKLFK